MTQLDLNTPAPQRDIDVLSRADRDALLRMLDEKPAAVIANALRRSTFTDRLLDNAPGPSLPQRSFRVPILLLVLGCVGVTAYVVPHETITRFIQEPRSVMGMTQSEVAKTAASVRGEKYEVVVPRLSENMRNAVKNYVPEADGARPIASCAALDAQLAERSFSPQRTESADAWIKRLDGLRKTGTTSTLPLELRKFSQAYPTVTVPAKLRKFACAE
jgi:hypothetical protein